VRKTWAWVLGVIAGVVLAACPVTVVAASGRPSAAGPSASTGAFPVLVHSADGTMGAGSQVVGVDKYSTYPADAPRTKFTGYESSAEDYLYLRPDLVIFAFETGTLIQQLKTLHIPALLLPPATGMVDVDSQLAELGAATGHETGARQAETSLAKYLTLTTRAAGNAGRGKTYYIEVDPTYYTATSKTFIGAEFSLFGMRDIADAAGHGSAYPQISAEYILKENPDYVFLADTVCCHQTPATFDRRPGFSVLSAVRLHHVIGVNDSVAAQWGPHTIETFVNLLASVLRP
jgi:iron complex transport system substrate-binding protein